MDEFEAVNIMSVVTFSPLWTACISRHYCSLHQTPSGIIKDLKKRRKEEKEKKDKRKKKKEEKKRKEKKMRLR